MGKSDNLNHEYSGPKTGLKFTCENCGEEIIVLYLTIGEESRCSNCEEYGAVPEDAKVIEEVSEVLAKRKRDSTIRAIKKKFTLADRIKEKYFRIESWIGFIATAVSILLLESSIENAWLRYFVSGLIGYMVTITVATFRKEEEDSTPKSELEKGVEGEEYTTARIKDRSLDDYRG